MPKSVIAIVVLFWNFSIRNNEHSESKAQQFCVETNSEASAFLSKQMYGGEGDRAQKKLRAEARSCNLGCGGRDRTTDLQVMSLTSYHCSTPRYNLSD